MDNNQIPERLHLRKSIHHVPWSTYHLYAFIVGWIRLLWVDILLSYLDQLTIFIPLLWGECNSLWVDILFSLPSLCLCCGVNVTPCGLTYSSTYHLYAFVVGWIGLPVGWHTPSYLVLKHCLNVLSWTQYLPVLLVGIQTSQVPADHHLLSTVIKQGG